MAKRNSINARLDIIINFLKNLICFKFSHSTAETALWQFPFRYINPGKGEGRRKYTLYVALTGYSTDF